ncbi:RraA family protein [Streptomyces sp. 900105755]
MAFRTRSAARAVEARENGALGAVIDGPARDSDALAGLDYPVWCPGTCAGHTDKQGPDAANTPVVCGGVLRKPGDVIVTHGDGVISIPVQALPEVARGARNRVEQEHAIRAATGRGEHLRDVVGLDRALEAPEAEEHDHTWKD